MVNSSDLLLGGAVIATVYILNKGVTVSAFGSDVLTIGVNSASKAKTLPSSQAATTEPKAVNNVWDFTKPQSYTVNAIIQRNIESLTPNLSFLDKLIPVPSAGSTFSNPAEYPNITPFIPPNAADFQNALKNIGSVSPWA